MPNDILLEGFDLMTANGDLLTGEATRQHQQLLLFIAKGELRDLPMRGVGIQDWMLADDFGGVNGAVKRDFEADGMTVDQVWATKNPDGSLKNVDASARYGEDYDG